MQAGFLPDSISTDLHIGSMNAGMKDMLNVMSKFLAMGMPLDDVIAAIDVEPGARDQAGGSSATCRSGPSPTSPSCASRRGTFGFVDMYGARLSGTQRLACELTLRDGKVVYDLNGISRPDWTTLPKGYRQTGDARWDAITPAPVRQPR